MKQHFFPKNEQIPSLRFRGALGRSPRVLGIPSDKRDGVSLIVADDSDHKKLVMMGYIRLGKYSGAGVERAKRSYYFSTVSGRSNYVQGALQTVQSSAGGVDLRTGRTLTGHVSSGQGAARVDINRFARKARRIHHCERRLLRFAFRQANRFGELGKRLGLRAQRESSKRHCLCETTTLRLAQAKLIDYALHGQVRILFE
jgi:hypothetical protein